MDDLPEELPQERTDGLSDMLFSGVLTIPQLTKHFKPNISYEYLNEVRKNNKFPFLLQSIAAILFTAVITVAIVYFTTDDFDNNYAANFIFENINKNDDAFLFYLRDVPLVILTFSYSLIFFLATSKYITVFEPNLIKQCGSFLSPRVGDGVMRKLFFAVMTSRIPANAIFGILIALLSESFSFGLAIIFAMSFSFSLNDLIDFKTGKDIGWVLSGNYVNALYFLVSGILVTIFANRQFAKKDKKTASLRVSIVSHFVWPLLLFNV